MPPIRRPASPKPPKTPARKPSTPATKAAGGVQTWTINGNKMNVWTDPPRGSSELIRNAYPAVYFTDGLKPRQRMKVSTPEGEIELVGVAKNARPKTPARPPAPPQQVGGVTRPPAPPRQTGGKPSAAGEGNFFNVRGGFSTYAFPEHTIRDYVSEGPDGYRASVGEQMTIAEWKANGYPGGKAPQTELQREQSAHQRKQKSDIEEKVQRDTEEAELRQEMLETMTPEDRQRYEDGERELNAIAARDRDRKGYPFFRR